MGLIALGLCGFALVGCTVVGVRGPVGESLTEEEASKFVGDWGGEDGGRLKITLEADSSALLLTTFTDEGKKDEEMKLLATGLDDDSVIIWGAMDEAGFVTPLKAVGSDGAIVLFPPDLEEVKRLAAEGTLKPVPTDARGSYLVEPDGIEAQLKTKTFWSLDDALPLIKAPLSDDPKEVTAP